MKGYSEICKVITREPRILWKYQGDVRVGKGEVRLPRGRRTDS
jgi:hypothetical protein